MYYLFVSKNVRANSLPPINMVVGSVSRRLVVLEVGQHRCVYANVEVITLQRTEWHKRSGHRPAMEVSRNVDSGV